MSSGLDAMDRHNSWSQSFTLLSFVTAALLLMVQWQSLSSSSTKWVAGLTSKLVLPSLSFRLPELPLAVAREQAQRQSDSSDAAPSANRILRERDLTAQTATPTSANSTSGQVASTAQPQPVVEQTRMVVDLSDRVVYLYEQGELKASYSVGVGQPGWETPTGEFRVIQMETYPLWQHPITGEVIGKDPANPLGSRWIEFWTDGEHKIGFHGTNQPETVGFAVSHGCLRMRESDVQKLYSQVAVGDVVIVRP